MKKIDKNGYEVKAVSLFPSRDGFGLHANLYFKNKKIAQVHDAGNGSAMEISFISKSDSDTFDAYVKKMYKEITFEADAHFINVMVEEKENIKIVKRDRNKRTYFNLKSDDELAAQRFLNIPYCEKAKEYLSSTYGDDVACIGNEVFEIYPAGRKAS